VSDRVRAFVALAVPEDHRQGLGRYLAACADLAPDYRWVEPEGLHLTLRFLGSLEPDVLARVGAVLRGVHVAPFWLSLGEPGRFGARSSPRAIWLGVEEGQESCATLAATVEAACQGAGLPPEPRAFKPHLTLARSRRDGARLPALPPPPQLHPWPVEDFVLYESRLRGGHPPAYVPLSRYRL
jgi:2'-5' RNA ligase